jgi:hypothetical protein
MTRTCYLNMMKPKRHEALNCEACFAAVSCPIYEDYVEALRRIEELTGSPKGLGLLKLSDGS